MNNEGFEQKLAAVSKLPPGELRDETPIDPGSWDSVEILELIAAIDEGFRVTVPINELNGCRTVGELRALIGREAAAGRS